MSNYEVVVGIDFGSSGSGFAYSYFDKNKIFHGQIYGASVDHKVATEIILDDDNYVLQFGSNCSKYLKEKGLESGHYFKDIKMELYENKENIKAKNSEKVLPLITVIQKIIESIKYIAIKEISENRQYLAEKTERIKWVVTVPAIWDEHQKSVMMESCINAGLIDNNTDKSLFFALEPEAASLYCSINKEIDRNYLKKGKYYIVCDLGGGTGDIVAHLVGSNNHLAEIAGSCGGKYGSNEIDKYIFKEVIMKLFLCNDFNTFYKKYKEKNNIIIGDENYQKAGLFEDWCELERKIKDFKEGSTISKIESKNKYPINCSLFKEIFDDDTDINDLVEEYNDTINESSLALTVRNVPKKWIVEFPYEIIFNCMKNQANSISEIINEINSKEEIKAIIFVGGYSSNEILINLIKNNLKNLYTFLKPSNPSLAIMEGAVIFGIEPSTITGRKAKYTIGAEVSDPWDDKKHSGKGKKFYDESLQDSFCEKCFSKFIEINQNLEFGKEISKIYYLDKKGSNFIINFYKTKKVDPIFIFENDVSKIGECRINIVNEFKNKEDRKLKIIMKFGGTFIDVIALHLKSGKSVKTKLIFD